MKHIKCSGTLLGILFCLFGLKVFAQQNNLQTYTGKIINETGKALTDVNINVKGSPVSARSDQGGVFKISCNPLDTIIYAKAGTELRRTAAGDQKQLIVILPGMAAMINDDINIPFGKRSKRDLNYAISSLQADQLPAIPISNLSGLLAGRLSGLQISWTNYQPGASGIGYQVRGKSSFAGGASPTILVDGVVRDFEDMDISEIESVTVLKDAAGLNWYGLNAGNGAILVTTKHGKIGPKQITFEAQTGFESISKMIKPLNSYDFATLYNQGLANAGQAPAYNATALSAYQNHTDPYLYPDNNYSDQFLNKTAPVQHYALSFSGGSERVRYFTSLSYFDQKGIFKETETPNYDSNFRYRRYNFRIDLDYEATKTLSITLLAGLRNEVRNDLGNGSGAVLSNLFNLPPNAFPILNADGTYGGTSLYQNNPLGQVQASGYTSTSTNVLLASLMAKQKLNFITTGLSANVFFSYDGYGNYSDGLSENYAVYNQTVTPAQTYRTPAVVAYRSAAFGTNTKNNELWMGFDYDRQFSTDHKVTASVRAQQYVSAAIDRLDYRGRMLVGRADYSFRNRYQLSFTGSYSGSEDYAPGRRFGFFPAVSAGWIVSDESLLKNSELISFLKIRGSYGRTGNVAPTYDGSGNVLRLPYRTLYNRGGGPAFGSSFSGTNTAFIVTPAGNALTTWEKVDRLDIGTDINFLKNTLSFSADYFDETRNDILGSANLPGILGQSVASVNFGKVNSTGVDLSGNYSKSLGSLNISLNANFTYAKSLVLAQSLADISAGQSPIGLLVNSRHYYIAEGLFQSQAEINASPKQSLSGLVVPGDIKYKDVNNDGKIDGNDDISTDYTDIPKIYYGFGLNLKYKLFDISAQFQGISGKTIDINGIVHAGPNGLNQLSLDSWTPATAATAKYPRIGLTDNANNTASSTFWLRSGDYLKLRTVEFGISTPNSINQKLHFKGARLFVGGYNLLTFSKLKDLDIDPEIPAAGTGTNFPFVKTYTLGINVKF